MRDPDSAKFDEDWLVGFARKKKGDTTIDVCGKVNGRNGVGGYTGMQCFYVGLMNLGPSHSHPGPLWSGIAAIQYAGQEERFFRGFPICDFLKWK